MKLVKAKNIQDASRLAADVFREYVAEHRTASVVLAMGNTPMPMYELLSHDRAAGRFDPSELTVFQLDAYVGLAADDERSLSKWLDASVVKPWALREEQVVRLPDDSVNPEKMCIEYAERVEEKHGFDLVVLGLGPNGHLGFNEPPARRADPTRVVQLTPESIRSNAVYWGGEDRVPRTSVTAGMDVLLAARQIILLVSGAHKQDIVRRTLTEPVSDEVPASHLQRHPNTLVIVDEGAWSDELTTHQLADGASL